MCSDRCRWLHIWEASISNITVDTAWTDTAVALNDGTRCVTRHIHVVRNGEWPVEARRVIDGAGVASRFESWGGAPRTMPALHVPPTYGPHRRSMKMWSPNQPTSRLSE